MQVLLVHGLLQLLQHQRNQVADHGAQPCTDASAVLLCSLYCE
jgi:hypothetical protein